MDPHLFGGKLSKLSSRRFAVYTFMALATLASQLVSGATGETAIETGTNTRFAEIEGELEEQLIGGEIKVSIDISGITSRPRNRQIVSELSMEETSRSSFSSNSIPRAPLSPRARRSLVSSSSPGTNSSPAPGPDDPTSG